MVVIWKFKTFSFINYKITTRCWARMAVLQLLWCLFVVNTIFLNVFERSLLCSPTVHLFDQKYRKKVIFWNIIRILNNYFLFEYILKCNLLLWCKLNFQHQTKFIKFTWVQVQNKTVGTAPLWTYGAAWTTASCEVCPNSTGFARDYKYLCEGMQNFVSERNYLWEKTQKTLAKRRKKIWKYFFPPTPYFFHHHVTLLRTK